MYAAVDYYVPTASQQWLDELGQNRTTNTLQFFATAAAIGWVFLLLHCSMAPVMVIETHEE
jgi:hypothetical protein